MWITGYSSSLSHFFSLVFTHSLTICCCCCFFFLYFFVWFYRYKIVYNVHINGSFESEIHAHGHAHTRNTYSTIWYLCRPDKVESCKQNNRNEEKKEQINKQTNKHIIDLMQAKTFSARKEKKRLIRNCISLWVCVRLCGCEQSIDRIL